MHLGTGTCCKDPIKTNCHHLSWYYCNRSIYYIYISIWVCLDLRLHYTYLTQFIHPRFLLKRTQINQNITQITNLRNIKNKLKAQTTKWLLWLVNLVYVIIIWQKEQGSALLKVFCWIEIIELWFVREQNSAGLWISRKKHRQLWLNTWVHNGYGI